MHFVQTLALTVGLAASALSATTNTGNMVNTGNNEVDMTNIVGSETLRPVKCTKKSLLVVFIAKLI